MSDDLNKRTEFLLSRRGITFVRWRALRAYLLHRPPCPTHDDSIRPVLARLDKATAAHLSQEFRDAFFEANLTAREMATDRHPYPSDHRPSRGGLDAFYPDRARNRGPQSPAARAALRRSFKWRGQLAFARGIDRSPTHDRQFARMIREFPNELALELLRSWEAGWDDAFDYGTQLRMERMSILEIPRVIDARSIPKNHGTSRKD